MYQEETGGGDTPSGNGLIPDGTYTKTSTTSFNKDSETYKATVTITVSGGVVTSVTASGPTKSSKNISYFNKAINGIKSQLVNETADSSIKSFDSVSGATKSSQLIRNAVQQIVSENIDSSSSSTKTYYVLTSTLTSGKKYIIINRNSAGSGVALGSISDSKFSPVSLTVKSADSTINSPHIDTADTDCVYTITGSASSFTMKNHSGNFIRIYDKKASTTSQSSATSLKYASNKISYYDSKKAETRYIYYKSDKNEYKFESSGTSLYFYEEYTPPAPAKTYTVKFYTYDGELIKSYTAEEGTYPSTLLESAYQNPSRDSTDAYDYTFNGWARDMYQTDGTKLSGLPKLTENVSYYQAFVATPRKYAVTWKNWDKTNNNETAVSYIEYGDRPVYPNSGTPEKADDTNYTYTFSGWSTSPNQTQGTAIEDLPDVTEAITYYACFTPNPVLYTVTWKNYDGVTLATESVAYGYMPSYTGATPTKPQQGRTVYTHSGWTPNITTVTGDVTYTATFDESVLIDDGIYGDNSIAVQTYGYTPIVAVNVVDGYIRGIYADADTSGYNSRCLTNALEGIREQLLNKSVSEVDNVDAVSGATLSSNALIAEIRKGLSEDPKPPYTVTWKDYDNSVIKTQSDIMYGTRTAYDDDIPVREADADYTYTFDKWNPDLSVFVTENKTYTATYSREQNMYTLDLGDNITLNLNDMTFTGADILSGCYDYNNDGKDDICVYPKDIVFTVNGKQISARTEGKYGLRFVSEDTTIAENCDNDWWFELTGQQGTTTVHAQVFDIVSGKTLAEKDITVNVTKPILYVNVTWVDGDGNTLKTESVEIGDTPSYSGATPTKTATAQYSYTFKDWDKPLTAVTEDTTYTATFNEMLREYTVTFVDEDGTTVLKESTSYPYGTQAIDIVKPIDPYKNPSAEYTYTFASWTPEVTTVEKDVVYKAVYTESPREYTITFTDDNGNVLQRETLVYGTMPEYKGETPVKSDDAQYSYTFKGWLPDIVAVCEDVVYTPNFEATVNNYTVTFLNDEGTELSSKSYPYGTKAEDIEIPTEFSKENPEVGKTYTFTNWDKTIADVTENAVYTAVYSSAVNQYTVKFVNDKGTLLSEKVYPYGTKAEDIEIPTGFSKEEPETGTTYTFTGWNHTVADVTEDVTYTATYNNALNEYTVTFVNENGDELQKVTATYGTMPQYSGETPTKESTAQYSYIFNGWSPELVAVTEEVTYTATYTEKINSYHVTWKNYDGSIFRVDEVLYGEMPDSSGITPIREQDKIYDYDFSDWKAENTEETGISTVTEDVIYIAQYNATQTGYQIFIEDYAKNGVVIDGLVSGEYYRGEVKFTVKSSMAVVFGIDNKNGTYTRMYCQEKENGQHEFTITVTDSNVYLVKGFKGDFDCNGKIQLRDATFLSRYRVGSYTANALNLFMGDIDGNGRIQLRDSTLKNSVSELQSYMKRLPIKERIFYINGQGR